jgi:hypothetical protein
LVALTSLAAGSIINYNLGPYQGKQTGELSLFSQLIKGGGQLAPPPTIYCVAAN